ncbi:MAG TPA: hypothetical protein VH309_08920, partial [Elusimicrobiota bacterium]|nr:hypothetical protein [Elusimicrobiota bacterium]
MPASAQILCTKCGSASAEARLECAKCGGRNARVCGKCGNQNSVAKNFCDKCGQSIAELGAIAPPPKAQLPGSTTAGIPATVIKRLPPAGAPPPPAAVPAPGAGRPLPPARAGALPPPGQPSAAFASPLDDLWSAPAAPPAAA